MSDACFHIATDMFWVTNHASQVARRREYSHRKANGKEQHSAASRGGNGILCTKEAAGFVAIEGADHL